MNHLGISMHTGSLPGDQLVRTEVAISMGALLVSRACSGSCKIKDDLNYLVNIVGGKEEASSFFQGNNISRRSCRNSILAVSCPSYKQELEFLNNQIWI